MNKKKTIFFGMILIIFSISVQAQSIDCVLDFNPYIGSDIPFLESKTQYVCETDLLGNYECVSYVLAGENLGLVDVFPIREDVKYVGVVETFESSSKTFNVFFVNRANLVRSDVDINAGVLCSNGSVSGKFNVTITPEYRDLDETANFIVYLKNQPAQMFLLSIGLVIIFLVVLRAWQSVKTTLF